MDNAQGLSDSHINSFLDESAEAGGVDARVTEPAPQHGMSTTATEGPQYGASTVEDEAQRQVVTVTSMPGLDRYPSMTGWNVVVTPSRDQPLKRPVPAFMHAI